MRRLRPPGSHASCRPPRLDGSTHSLLRPIQRDPLLFDASVPGVVCVEQLQIHNSFVGV